MISEDKFVWAGEKQLTVNDVSFLVTHDADEYLNTRSEENHFLLIKHRLLIEKLYRFGLRNNISKILEVGIFQGGSIVLNDQMFHPEKIVGLEYVSERVPALDTYVSSQAKEDRIKLYYDTDQSDTTKVGHIMESEFPDRDIDLVVDDASHRYRHTRACFNTCFPFVKPGGHYIIEDWGWAHWPGEHWQKKPWQVWKRPPFRGGKALSNILIELFMLAASRPDLVARVEADKNDIVVTRGPGQLPARPFDMADHYLLRGKRFRPFL